MAYADEVLADSPLAYYRLGEASGTTMVDSSGNGYHGAYVNAPTLGAAGLLVGDGDKAVTFAGSVGHGFVSNSVMPQVTGSALTVEAWIKPSDLTGLHSIFVRSDFGVAVSAARYAYDLMTNGTKLRVSVNAGSGTTYRTAESASGVLALGVSHHVALTYDGAALRGYVNGAQVVSLAVTGVLAGANNSSVGVGIDGAQTYFRWLGTLDEAAIYGTALSSARIAAHYAAGTGAAVTITGTLAATLPGPLS